MNNSNSQEEPDTLIYEASSRGYFYRVEINSETIVVWEDRSMEESKTGDTRAADWQELINLTSQLELNTLGELEVSTEQSATDRSAMSMIAIRKGMSEYESPTFDTNTPPEKLKPLITLMRTLAETVE